MGNITWYYNRFGHVELYDGEVDLFSGVRKESDRYLQNDLDVESFFEHVGLDVNNVSVGDWDIISDPGYFI